MHQIHAKVFLLDLLIFRINIGLSDQERKDIHDLIVSQSNLIKEEDPEVEGFNIGWNCGEVAGQTVFHAHVHLIPRRKGDVENPRGGVRYVFPEKANY